VCGALPGLGVIRASRAASAERRKWYRKAADQDQHFAQVLLGSMYQNGQGVPQDYLQAHMWFNLQPRDFR
jgi:TPR repeat protein